MVTSLLGKGVPVPAHLMPLVNATVENLLIPLMAQNEEQKNQIIQAMQQAQQQSQQPQMQEENIEQQNIQQPPQEQMVA